MLKAFLLFLNLFILQKTRINNLLCQFTELKFVLPFIPVNIRIP